MSFIKRIFVWIVSSVLVSGLIFFAGVCLMTQEFPPNVSHLKNLYFTFQQLKTLNNEHQRNQSKNKDQSIDRKLDQFSMYNKQVGAIQQHLQAADDVDTLSQMPSYSTVADRVRAETEQRQRATQYAVQMQHLKDEIYRLKTENQLLRRKLDAVIQRR